MRVLDLFSGIGGFSLGLERAGMTTVAFCEIDPFCRAVLKKHWPDIPCHDDVTTMKFTEGMADVICGGFPCQDISVAGKRAGVTGARSGLYRQMVRAIRVVRPKLAIMENVAALLSNGMGRVLGDLAEDRLDAEWDSIPASDIKAPHGRPRVWIIIANPDKLEQSGRRHSGAGWWLWGEEETRKASNAHSLRKLQPPRFLGDIRRRIDHAVSAGTWWSCDWQEKFESLRGMDDGVPTRLDKNDVAGGISHLGNAVVPQIPEIIGRAIMESA